MKVEGRRHQSSLCHRRFVIAYRRGRERPRNSIGLEGLDDERRFAMIPLDINGKRQTVDLPGETRLLWTLRDELGLTGTKFGCGMALCGACTVHLDGAPIRSCVTPISAAVGKKITTIEAIGATPIGQRVVAAWR